MAKIARSLQSRYTGDGWRNRPQIQFDFDAFITTSGGLDDSLI